MDFSSSTIDLWADYLNAVHDARYLAAFPGRPDGGGTYTFLVPGYPGKVYIRMSGQESYALHEATNRAQVPLNPNLKCWCVYENGELVIDHADAASLRFLYGDNASIASVLWDSIRSLLGPSLLRPFQVYPTQPTGLSVTIAPGWYRGQQRYPDANPTNITLVPTATSNKVAWIILTVDYTTGVVAQTLDATDHDTDYVIDETTLPDISLIPLPDNSFAIAAILLENGATSVPQSKIVPMEMFATQPPGISDIVVDADGAVVSDADGYVVVTS